MSFIREHLCFDDDCLDGGARIGEVALDETASWRWAVFWITQHHNKFVLGKTELPTSL